MGSEEKAVACGQWLEDLYRLKISIALANHSLDLFAQLLVSKRGGAIWKRVTGFGVCLLQGRSSSQWGREEGWKIGCWVSLRFRLFGRHEISIFLVLRTIPDGFPLNPTYGLNRDREKISIALPNQSLDLSACLISYRWDRF